MSIAYEEQLYGILEAEIELGNARNFQKRIGPSGLANPCYRCLGRALAGIEKPQTVKDRWLTFIGTCVHAGCERALLRENKRLGHDRFLAEHRVTVGQVLGEDIDGSADGYDLETDTVIDWKVVGDNTLAKPPSRLYLGQIDLYGLGFANAGFKPKRTCIMYLPRNQFRLRRGRAVIRDWDEGNAREALRKANDIAGLIRERGGEAVIPKLRTDPDCYDCNRT